MPSPNDRYYKYIFIVLVYRNTQDLADFFASNKVENSKTIVVNSYYDDATEAEFKRIALANNAEFLSIPNKGYGYGNNRGIEYALSHYRFEYLIVSNADIAIEKWDENYIHTDGVSAPKILTIKGKNQNPSCPFKPSKFRRKIQKWIYEGYHNRLITALFIYSRLTKIAYYCISPWKKRIFSPHGAFFIMPRNVAEKCAPLFDDEMFLFNEEEHLGHKLRQLNQPVYYTPYIIIRHKEDGSIGMLKANLFDYARDSFLRLYDNWH